MQIRLREDEKRMMEDDVIPIPDLMMGEEDLRGKGGKLGLLGWDMYVCMYAYIRNVLCCCLSRVIYSIHIHGLCGLCLQVLQCLAA